MKLPIIKIGRLCPVPVRVDKTGGMRYEFY